MYGAREKWILGSGNQWYFLLPNGELRKYLGTMPASLGSGGLVATLDPSFYADPSLLWNAKAARDTARVGDRRRRPLDDSGGQWLRWQFHHGGQRQ